jgi:glucans biosynthesis protein
MVETIKAAASSGIVRSFLSNAKRAKLSFQLTARESQEMCRTALIAVLFASVITLPAQARGFDFQDVIAKAQNLAQQSYQAPEPIPRFMQDLSYEQYQGIRFKPDQSLWHASHSRFQVMLISPGLFYRHPVKLHVIDAQGVHDLSFRKDYFTFSDEEVERRVPPDLGYAGFKLTYPLQDANTQNQFMVFAGASYFRGVGRDNTFGISGRGVALDTGLPSGEQFPSFVEYWLERPGKDATVTTLYGLLDGKSVTGAYRFTVYPGMPTKLKVEARFFTRDAIQLLGIAPLTSMFYYGENTPRPHGQWRSQVHDSDGLLVHNGVSGEWLWRPLLNPKNLEMDYFQTENVQGFGLLQRHDHFRHYQDLGAHYETRPSAWVETQGDWGRGHVVLVQLPTDSETNDNIVAFWSPQDATEKGQSLSYTYTVSFGDSTVASETTGQVLNTFVGDGNQVGGGNVPGAYRFIVDFAGGPLAKLSANAPVVSSVTAGDNGEVIEHFAEYSPSGQFWRLSILAKPAEDKPLSLRAYLSKDGQPVSETWNYRLPASNNILGNGG